MGLEPKELQWKIQVKKYNPNMDLELDPELTPHNTTISSGVT